MFLLSLLATLMIPEVYAILAVSVFLVGFIFFLMPYIYKKYPHILSSVIRITESKDSIKTVYYFASKMILKDISNEKREEIFIIILTLVNTVENLAKTGQLRPEERKPTVLALAADLLKELDIDYTVEVESLISLTIELAITYANLRKSSDV